VEDFFAVPEEELRHTSRALRKIFERRGWRDVKVIRASNILFFATRPDGKQIRFGSCSPSITSRFATQLADSKIATYFLLEQEGIPQPETVWLSENKEDWKGQLEELLAKYPRIVIKPTDGAHGIGVKTDITTLDEAMDAARECANNKQRYYGISAQEQLDDDVPEIRAICVDYKMVGAYERVPAAVTGDGEHSILELIELENRELRSEPYKGKPARIDMTEARHYLDKNDIDVMRVPAPGEEVRVVKVCNVGAGGVMRHVEFTNEQIAQAERIARLFELPVIGIDFYGDRVIEVNASPALYCPTGDEWADKCVESYVDYLEKM